MHNYSIDILEQVTKDHPYFSAAQFYLLKKTEPSSEKYNKQAAKTAIFFNNPHWLNFQLLQTQDNYEEIKIIPLPEISFEETTNINVEEKADIATEPLVELEHNENAFTKDEEDNVIMEKEIEPMKLELKMPPENSKNDNLLFEPVHLVDYFASQGIKLSDEVQQGDKLGKQLKSFTEWLKTMKKIHTGENEKLSLPLVNTTEQTDMVIQTLAEKSNTEDEILTEAMAEVFAKQGKKDKSVELYQKLSLLNPSKIAYFAAKIENLKGS